MIGIVIALLASFWVAGDAKRRGMNPLGWAAGVFLLLIVFLPLYFGMRKPLLEDQKPQKDEDIIDDLDAL